MASFQDPRALLETLSAPIGELIAAVGHSVADAQHSLDAQTIANFQAIYSAENTAAFEALRSIGYRPTWYHIPEISAEVNVALTVSGTVESQAAAAPAQAPNLLAPRIRVYAAPVDAGYTSKYNYELKAASAIKFRIVPVPPSPAAEALRVVPDVVGQTWSAARTLLQRLDVPYRLPDPAPAETDVVASQSPAAGTLLASGQLVEFVFGS
jgi:hypothetical protein